jgi:hypothetical protein
MNNNMNNSAVIFEMTEHIRFFGQLASTEGISSSVKDKANEYIEKLINAMEPSINKLTASAHGFTIVN